MQSKELNRKKDRLLDTLLIAVILGQVIYILIELLKTN